MSNPNPILRPKGTCSVCGGPADALWHLNDWWHNKETDCDGRKTGHFVHAPGDEP